MAASSLLILVMMIGSVKITYHMSSTAQLASSASPSPYNDAGSSTWVPASRSPGGRAHTSAGWHAVAMDCLRFIHFPAAFSGGRSELQRCSVWYSGRRELMSSSSWSSLLLGGHADAQLLADVPAEIRSSIDLRIDEIIRAARLAWPAVDLSSEQFVAHLARHLPAGTRVEIALEQMHTNDLYLARACALGDRNAIDAFEQYCVTDLEYVVSRHRAFSDLAAEVKQRVRERVLVGNAGPPRIDGFSGRGDLRGWVRVLAVREAIGVVRRSHRETSIDDDAQLHAFVTLGDPGVEQLKACYVEEFKQAFSAALRGLSPRDQTLLCQHVIDGMTIDQLGVLYRMHRATAARNLQRVRREVLVAIRTRLASRLEVRPSQVDSILRLVRSRLDVTLRWLARRRRRRDPGGLKSMQRHEHDDLIIRRSVP